MEGGCQGAPVELQQPSCLEHLQDHMRTCKETSEQMEYGMVLTAMKTEGVCPGAHIKCSSKVIKIGMDDVRVDHSPNSFSASTPYSCEQ
eukprot:1133400-Pelagomonas_calceolata.AAC.7